MMDTAEKIEGFARVAGIDTHAATPAAVSHQNIFINAARGLPRFEHLPDFNRRKRRDEPIALIGGGPSLKRTLADVVQFPRMMAAGSVHDFLIENGIAPEFAVCCDPDQVSQAYFQNPSHKVKYLLSSHCDPALYDHLRDYDVCMWHCFSQDPGWHEAVDQVEMGGSWHAVAGGCTVGLRCLSMAILLGFSNIHFFGFDSCVEVKDGRTAHHAYDYATAGEEMQGLHNIRTGNDRPGDETFVCEGYQLAQAYHFKQFVTAHGHLFDATFHGGGLLANYYDSYLAGVAARVAALTPEERVQYERELAEL